MTETGDRRRQRLLPRLRLLLWAPGVGAGVVAVALLAWLLPGLIYESVEQTLSSSLELLAPLVKEELEEDPQGLQTWLRSVAEGSGIRLTVIAEDGVVLADSERTAEGVTEMDNHRTRPEVILGLEAERGSSVRRSATTGKHYVYSARLVTHVSGEVFVLRGARPLRELDLLKFHLFKLVLVMLIGAGFGSMLVVWWIRQRVLAPFDELVEASDRLARSDLSRRIEVPGVAELSILARSVNRLASRAEGHVEAIDLERRRLAEILNGMAEGVMVVGEDGGPIFANRAWRSLMGLAADAEDRDLLDLARRPAVFELVEVAQEEAVAPPSVEIRSEDLELAVQARRVEAFSGVLLVARDVTETKRLARVRRDFVANVSHELKTPLAIIRAAAETVQSLGSEDEEARQRFTLRIIQQCHRLEDLLQDLLTLSRLESSKVETERADIDLTEIARHVVEQLEPLAESEAVEIRIDAPPETRFLGDAFALERLLLNLLSNAIKYGRKGGVADLRIRRNELGVEIEVEDRGQGMAPEELDRIFERFYRVDKGRGREQGGSGLGLAIVKHVVQSHRGEVSVESTIGRGTCFRVFLPASRLRPVPAGAQPRRA